MKTNLLILAFLICFTGIIIGQKKTSNGKQPNVPSVKNANFIDTPRYYYRIIVDATKLPSTLDTIQGILDRIGETMTVTEAKAIREVATRNVRRIIGTPVFDSLTPKK